MHLVKSIVQQQNVLEGELGLVYRSSTQFFSEMLMLQLTTKFD